MRVHETNSLLFYEITRMQTNNWMFFDGKEAGILSDQERMPTECFFIKRNIQLDIKKHSMSDWMFLDAKEIGIVRFYFPGVPPAPLPASYKCTMTQFRERNSTLNLFVDFNPKQLFKPVWTWMTYKKGSSSFYVSTSFAPSSKFI